MPSYQKKPLNNGICAGFTMLELSVVLIIIGLVTAVGITSGIGVIEGSKRAQTIAKLNTIENALKIYRDRNNRLPCPSNAVLVKTDLNYGVEATTPGTCLGANFGSAGNVVEGSIPTKTLNIADDFMYDGWGRKFAYAVDSNATDTDAFSTIGIADMCGITVNDASLNPRTTGAIYALVSFGPDGHGGYLTNGTRMNTGSVNTDVQTNCHCNTSANTSLYTPIFVQREPAEDPVNPKNSFENYVRFKERWQLTNESDTFTFAMNGSYRGPNLLAGFDLPVAGDNSAYAYKTRCGKLIKQADIDPVAEEKATGVVFTNDNQYAIVFSDAGCVMYPITNGVMQTGNATAIPSCPAYSASIKVAATDNEYLAMMIPNAPYVQLWKQSGSAFVALATPTPAPGAASTMMSLTRDYLLLGDGTNLTIYQRSSNTFTALGTQPAGVPTPFISAAISPNQLYVAVTVDGNISGTPAPSIRLWRIDLGPVFTALPAISIAANDTPYSITFSADGKYMVTGGTNGDNATIYRIDSGDVFTRLATPTGWTNSSDTAGIAFAFTNDSRYLAMATASTTRPLVLFRRVSANAFKFATVPDVAPAAGGLSVNFNY
jgi:prepilin-type N-terminal cleavage/methylation domain-containing protein